MRFLWLIALGLAACSTVQDGPIPHASGLTPDATGLQPVGTNLRIDFGRAEPGVIATVSRLLGADPIAIVNQTECGAGPMRAARWNAGLTLNFIDGDFDGWVVNEPGLTVAGGYRVGMAAPDLAMQDTTLGIEFDADGVFGLIEDASTVTTLWAGTTCFFR